MAVLALHLGLLWLLADSSTTNAARQKPSATVTRIALRLIPTPPPPATARLTPVAPPARSRAPQPTRATVAPKLTAPRALEATAITEPQLDAAARPEPAASTDPGPPSLLDTEATRRAIRASARSPSLGDLLARARDEPDRATPQEGLANGVKAAGKGDCLKGEFAGSGMGVLSLPFLVVAAARGACAK